MYLHIKSCRKPPLEMAYSIHMSRVGTILHRSYLNLIFLKEIELVTQWSKLTLYGGSVSLEAFQQVQTVTELIQGLWGSAQSSEAKGATTGV